MTCVSVNVCVYASARVCLPLCSCVYISVLSLYMVGLSLSVSTHDADEESGSGATDGIVVLVVVVVVSATTDKRAEALLLAMHGSDAVNVTLTDRPPMHAWSRSALFTSKS